MKRALSGLLLLSGAAVAAAAPAQAQQLTLGVATYGGTGCPQGTASVVVSPDAHSLSILYDQYFTEVGPGTTLARRSCNLAIPLHVPSGFSVSIIGIHYRGFNFLEPGASSTFRVEYFFAGGQGPVFTRNFAGPVLDDFLIHNDLGVAALVWSACGQDVILRTNSSIVVQQAGGANGLVSVDSEDVDSALVFLLQWQVCTKPGLSDGAHFNDLRNTRI